MVWPFSWNQKVFKKIFFLSLLLISTTVSAKDLNPSVKFDSAEIEVGSKKITVEIAATPQQHEKGLMYRETLEKNQGMLFLFDREQVLNFWMKNTYVDLSIAYINKKLKIVDIQEMKATTTLDISEPVTYPSKKPAMYALEMPKNWFKANNIKIGQTITLPKKSQ